MLIPIDVIILMITTSFNAALATDKDNKRKWINIICTLLGLSVIIYRSVYSN